MEQLTVDPLSGVLRLPGEIILNIISRLQVDSVLDCRLVCKTWRNLLLLPNMLHHHNNNINTYFADMHLHHRLLQHCDHQNKNSNFDTKLNFIVWDYNSLFYYVEYEENDVQSNLKHKRIKLPLPGDTESLVGSCNGLICLCVRLKSLIYDPIYICNPITREFVHLPRFIMNDNHILSSISKGFGYHRPTNEYKVVRVYYCLDKPPFIGHVQVYTLGSGIGWRDKGEITHVLECGFSSQGVLLDGALHWISTEGNIVAFDLADEEFRCLPTPPFSSPQWRKRSKILTLGGWLSIVYKKTDVDVEIWLLKKEKKKKNEEKQSASGNEQSWRWSREFTIATDAYIWMYLPFTITKSGEILLWYRNKSIVCCEPKSAAIPKKLLDLDEAIDFEQAISHFNSFISLKALGEDAKIL